MKEGQFFSCVGDLIYTRLQRCFLPHAHGTSFFFCLWKSIEESNLRMYVLQLHVIWTIWNHSLVEVRRLMPYISFTKFGVVKYAIYQISVCWRFDILDYGDVFHHMHMGLFFFGFWKWKEESNLSMYGIQLHFIWIVYLEPLFGVHVEVDAQYHSPSLEMSNVWYLQPVMCGYMVFWNLFYL